MNIDSILTEWRYRLPAGYPKTADDFGILRQVRQHCEGSKQALGQFTFCQSMRVRFLPS